MKKNRLPFGIMLTVLVLFSSCIDGKWAIPITSTAEAHCIYCGNNSEHALNQNSHYQLQEIIPSREIVFECETQETITTMPPTILPVFTPYEDSCIEAAILEIFKKEIVSLLTDEDESPQAPVKEKAPKETAEVKTPQATVAAKTPQAIPCPPVAKQKPVVKTQALYRVQIGAFLNYSNAQRNFNRLKSSGFSPALESSGNFTRVVIPRVEAQNLTATINLLKKAGFTDTWVRKEL